MFTFPRQALTNPNVAVIAAHRINILYDDYPVLYTGLNAAGQRIVGSYVSRDEDADDEIIYYVHFKTTENLYKAFTNKAITYRELLEANRELFIVEKNYDEESENIFVISVSDFSAPYLPAIDSFYPSQSTTPGLEYTFRLTGKLADENKADTEQASNAAIYFSALLAQSINLLNVPRVKVVQKPSSAGSFKLNFEVSFQEGSQLSLKGEEAIAGFQVKFLDYCLNRLNTELSSLFSTEGNVDAAPNFILLREAFKDLRQVIGKRKKKDEAIDELLKKDISKSISSLSKAIADLGSSFSGIEITNNDGSDSNILSEITNEVKYSIDYSASYIESVNQNFDEDSELTNYKIAIYHLNTDTRLGNAIIFTGKNNSILSKPRIKILGTTPLEKTEYTNSLYKGEMIDVVGKARRIGDKVLSIEIDGAE